MVKVSQELLSTIVAVINAYLQVNNNNNNNTNSSSSDLQQQCESFLSATTFGSTNQNDNNSQASFAVIRLENQKEGKKNEEEIKFFESIDEALHCQNRTRGVIFTLEKGEEEEEEETEVDEENTSSKCESSAASASCDFSSVTFRSMPILVSKHKKKKEQTSIGDDTAVATSESKKQTNYKNKNNSIVEKFLREIQAVAIPLCALESEHVASELSRVVASIRATHQQQLSLPPLSLYIHPTLQLLIGKQQQQQTVTEIAESLVKTNELNEILADCQRKRVRASQELRLSFSSSTSTSITAEEALERQIDSITSESALWESAIQLYRELKHSCEISREWQITEKILHRRIPKSLRDEVSEWESELVQWKNFLNYVVSPLKSSNSSSSASASSTSESLLQTSSSSYNATTVSNVAETFSRLSEYDSTQFQYPSHRIGRLAEIIAMNICHSIQHFARSQHEKKIFLEMFVGTTATTEESNNRSSISRQHQFVIRDMLLLPLLRIRSGFSLVVEKLQKQKQTNISNIQLPKEVSLLIDRITNISSLVNRYWILRSVLENLTITTKGMFNISNFEMKAIEIMKTLLTSTSSQNFWSVIIISNTNKKKTQEVEEINNNDDINQEEEKINESFETIASNFVYEISSLEALVISSVTSNFFSSSSTDSNNNDDEKNEEVETKNSIQVDPIKQFEIISKLLPLASVQSSSYSPSLLVRRPVMMMKMMMSMKKKEENRNNNNNNPVFLLETILSKLHSSVQNELSNIISSSSGSTTSSSAASSSSDNTSSTALNRHQPPTSLSNFISTTLSLSSNNNNNNINQQHHQRVATIKWNQMLAEKIELLIRHSKIVAPRGWMRLLAMRNSNGRWELSEALASFVGTSLSELTSNFFTSSSSSSSSTSSSLLAAAAAVPPDVIGTAIAIICLERLFTDDLNEWNNSNKMIISTTSKHNKTIDEEARDFIQAAEKQYKVSILDAASAKMTQLRVVRFHASQMQSNEEVQLFHQSVREWRDNEMKYWLNEIDTLIKNCKLWNSSSERLVGSVLQIKQQQTEQQQEKNQMRIQVQFPFELFHRLCQEESYLQHLIPQRALWNGTVFLRTLRLFYPIASTLKSLLGQFHHCIIQSNNNDGDNNNNSSSFEKTILVVLPRSYQSLQQLLLEGTTSLTWSNSSAQGIAEYVERFTKSLMTFSQQTSSLKKINRRVKCLVEAMKISSSFLFPSVLDHHHHHISSSSNNNNNNQLQLTISDFKEFGKELLQIENAIELLSPMRSHKYFATATHLRKDINSMLAKKLILVLKTFIDEFQSLDQKNSSDIDLTDSNENENDDDNNLIMNQSESININDNNNNKNKRIWHLENIPVSIRLISESKKKSMMMLTDSSISSVAATSQSSSNIEVNKMKSATTSDNNPISTLVTTEPSPSIVKKHWFMKLNEAISTLCSVRCPSGLIASSSNSSNSENNNNFTYILRDYISPKLLSESFGIIEEAVEHLQRHVTSWNQQYQLWNIDLDRLFETLSFDISSWISVVSTLKESSKKAFAVTETITTIRGVYVNASEIQKSIQSRCKNIIAIVVDRFIQVVFDSCTQLRSLLQKHRSKLESFNPSTTVEDCIAFMSLVSSPSSSSSSSSSNKKSLANFIEDAPNEINLIQQAQELIYINNKNITTNTNNNNNLPNGWIESDVLWTELRVLQDLYETKKAVVEGRASQLFRHLEVSASSLSAKIAKINEEFRSQDLDQVASQDLLGAKDKLEHFVSTSQKLISEGDSLIQAQKVLNYQQQLQQQQQESASDNNISSFDIEDDIRLVKSIEKDASSLSQVIEALTQFEEGIDVMRKTLFVEVNPKQIFQELAEMEKKLSSNNMSSMKTYLCHQRMVQKLRLYSQTNSIITDLRSNAFTHHPTRHWSALRRALIHAGKLSSSTSSSAENIHTSSSSVHGIEKQWMNPLQLLTLGAIWDCEPVSASTTHTIFLTAIQNAQGEYALENFINEVKEHWETLGMELTPYHQNNIQNIQQQMQNQNIYLVKGWHELSEKLSDHLTALQSIRNSPHFKIFEADTLEWEDKLHKVRDVSELLLEVQRRWLYLDGIFGGSSSSSSSSTRNSSSDIRHQLPQESYQFEKLCRDLFSILPSPEIIISSEIMLDNSNDETSIITNDNIDNINNNNNNISVVLWLTFIRSDRLLPTLERIAKELDVVERALLAYLESQRALFPRFYFVGDDDLLELLGGGLSDSASIARHLNSMFNGVSALQIKITSSMNNDVGNNMMNHVVEHAVGVISREGEVLNFVNKLLFRKWKENNNSTVNNKVESEDNNDNNDDDDSLGIVEWLEVFSKQLYQTLVENISDRFVEISSSSSSKKSGLVDIVEFVMKNSSQVSDVVLQLFWSYLVEETFNQQSSSSSTTSNNNNLEAEISENLNKLANSIRFSHYAKKKNISENVTDNENTSDHDVKSDSSSSSIRLKIERVITMFVYHRDTVRNLLSSSSSSSSGTTTISSSSATATNNFAWLSILRLYLVDNENKKKKKIVQCKMADATFDYSYEYLGVPERLVQTPLTDKAYLTLTQALHTKLGGAPAGPAGTGKTETVKSLSQALGRFVQVFCCDESFDGRAMQRIFTGLCEVGGFGCFDEFNRLREAELSAISQQIMIIQSGLRSSSELLRTTTSSGSSSSETNNNKHQIDFLGKTVTLHDHVGIFITMNPTYSGRSQLPDNLKQLFRPLSMAAPDRENIAEVMLFVRGFKHAEILSRKVVPLFKLCQEQLSEQAHYDFGLRALKSVLHAAGTLQRSSQQESSSSSSSSSLESSLESESSIVLQALAETVTPKLIARDADLFRPLLSDVFPELQNPESTPPQLRKAIERYCSRNDLISTDLWFSKVIQLYKILSVHHGVMLVGASNTGKSSCWRALFSAMVEVSSFENNNNNKNTNTINKITVDIIDPKCISKEALFGSLDVTTREWRDGIFTSILRKFAEKPTTSSSSSSHQDINNNKNEDMNMNTDVASEERHFILFDGDVDPEWVENLNSVLDDNKVLTLPTGERIHLPHNVQILFESSDLRHATLATVSRCGMVWFSDVIPLSSTVLNVSRNCLNETAMVRSGSKISHHQQQQQMNAKKALHLEFTPSSSSSSQNEAASSSILLSSSSSKKKSKQQQDHQHQSSSSSPFTTLQRKFKQLLEKLSSELNENGSLMKSLLIVSSAVSHIMEQKQHEISNSNKTSSSSLHHQHQHLHLSSPPIMEFNMLQSLRSIFSILFSFPIPTIDYAISRDSTNETAKRLFSLSLVWGLSSSFDISCRDKLSEVLPLPSKPSSSSTNNIFEYGISSSDGSWKKWNVPPLNSLSSSSSVMDSMIPTIDTIRHEFLLSSWLRTGSHFLLCGPPGSAKTFTITAVLNNNKNLSSSSSSSSQQQEQQPHSDYDAVFLNFSSATSPELVLKTLEPVTTIVKRQIVVSQKVKESSSVSSQQQQQHQQYQYVMIPTSFSSSSTTTTTSTTANTSSLLLDNTTSENKQQQQQQTKQRRLVVFCDEINLPTPDKYGTQHVIQFLKQIIEHGGFYRTSSDCAWISVENIQFVGACNSPSDPGRYPLSHRFLRWAPLLFVDFPSKESLVRIYTAYNKAALKRCSRISAAADSLANAMVQVYEGSRQKFTPDVQKHYIYSPRELSRWSRAIAEALDPLDDAVAATLSPEQLIRLAAHEGLRIFRDRLVTQEERKFTDSLMDKSFMSAFGGTLPPQILQRPMLYSTFFTRNYSSCEMEKTRRFLQEKFRLFSEEEFDAQIVVFDQVCEHVLRIDRVLRQPHGHMLLCGTSGVGRTTLSKFVAWMNNISVFQVKTHRGYTLDNFQQDLRSVMKRAGCDRERICFIFDESNILDNGFLEFMNALLASGDVPGLFEGEERAKLLMQIRESIKTSSSQTSSSQKQSTSSSASSSSSTPTILFDIDDDNEVYNNWFVKNVSRNLHVIFTMNPQNAEFSETTATSPALFNRCIVDWFGDWDEATMVHVATELTNRVPVAETLSTNNNTTSSGGAGDDDADEEDMLRGFLATSMFRIHEGVSIICDEIRVQNQFVNNNSNSKTTKSTTTTTAATFFVTPRHFIDFIHQFKSVYKEKRDEIVQHQRHLNAGLTKLAKTSSQVDSQMSQLREKEIVLATTSAEAQSMLDRIVGETQRAESAKTEATILTNKLVEEEKEIATKKGEAEKQLSGAVPALQAAASALSTVRPEFLREIRAYSKPPETVKRVLEAVVVILGEKSAPDWDTVKSYIRRDDFIAYVRAFQPSDVSTQAQDYVRKNYLTDPRFTPEEAMKASKAAGPLVQWVHAQVRYAEINVSIKPLKESIDTLSKQCKEQHVLLERAKKEVDENDRAINKLKQQYQETLQRQSAIKADIESVEKRCARANVLVTKLRAEKDRWEIDAGGLRSRVSNQLGDCVACAAFLSYAGFLEERIRRQQFRPLVERILNDAEISCSSAENLDIVEYLSKPSIRALWHSEGNLPRDDLCVENAIILSRSRRYCFVLDPAGQAKDFLSYYFSSSSSSSSSNKRTTTTKSTTTQTSFSEKNLLKTIEMSVRFGTSLIIHDAEQVDPMLNPLLNKEWRKSGGRVMMRLASLDIDVSPAFKMALMTRDAFARFSPDLCGRVSMINFTTTLSSLSSQFLHTLLKAEKPEVARVRADLTATRTEKTFKLRALEEQLLDAIAAAETDILENDDLLKSLETLKSESSLIAEQMETLEEQLESTVRVEEREYSQLSSVIAKTHFALQDMSQLQHMYRYSLSLVSETLENSLKDLPSSSSSSSSSILFKLRREIILRRFFGQLHTIGVRGMFEQDQLAFRLRLAQLRCEVLLNNNTNANIIPSTLWDFLLDRQISSSSSSKQQEQQQSSIVKTPSSSSSSSLLSESQWKQLEHLVSINFEIFNPVLESLVSESESIELKKKNNNNNQQDQDQDQEEEENKSSSWQEYLHESTGRDSAIIVEKLSHLSLLSSSSSSGGGYHPALIGCVNLCLVKILRPDHIFGATDYFISTVFDYVPSSSSLNSNSGKDEMKEISLVPEYQGILPLSSDEYQSSLYDLDSYLDTLTNTTPALLVSFSGYDPSPKIKQLASSSSTSTTKNLLSVAIGNPESLQVAQTYLEDGMRFGNWVLLLNVHFSPELLKMIEKRLHSSSSSSTSASNSNNASNNIHPSFRLFLVCEQSPVIPANLCKISRMFVFEAPKGVKANMRRLLTNLMKTHKPSSTTTTTTSQQLSSSLSSHSTVVSFQPVELNRVLFVAAWLHSIIVERLRYLPVGWTQKYEFSESDFYRSVSTLTSWISSHQKNQQQQQHISPSEIPWQILRKLISSTVYGGRIDSLFDTKLVDSLVESCLSEKMFDSDFSLAVGPEVNCENGVTLNDFESWVTSLPDVEPPEWLGLPAWATQLASSQRGKISFERLGLLQPKQLSSSTSSSNYISPTRHTAAAAASSSSPTTTTTIKSNIFLPLQLSSETWLETTESIQTQNLSQLVSNICNSAGASNLLLSTTSATDTNSSSDSSSSNSNNNNTYPLLMCLIREADAITNTISQIKQQLCELIEACKGNIRFSNSIRSLADCLMRVGNNDSSGGSSRNSNNNNIPTSWKTSLLASSHVSSNLNEFLSNIQKRVSSQIKWLEDASTKTTTRDEIGKSLLKAIPLGSLFFPGSVLTATRQYFARTNKIAIELTTLSVKLSSSKSENEKEQVNQIEIVGMQLQGACVFDDGDDSDGGEGMLTMPVEERISSVPVHVTLSWVATTSSGLEKEEEQEQEEEKRKHQKRKMITIPVYSNQNRTELLFVAKVPVEPDVFDSVWLTRRVCLIL